MQAGETKVRGNGMIGSDYFRRQATTLLKLIRVTQNPTVADRLIFMAEEFKSRAKDEPDESRPAASPPGPGPDRRID